MHFLKKYIKLFLFYLQMLKQVFVNPKLRSQLFNYKNIPIIIVSYNQLFHLKKLISFLIINEYKNIIIIDNNSNYKPLELYLDSLKKDVKIVKLKENLGHLAFWKIKNEYFKDLKNSFYVITDPDILPEKSCPNDFVKIFRNQLLRTPDYTKVGFSLKINDIPDFNQNKNKILKWESKFWENKLSNGNYIADIDTTFALYNPFYIYNESNFYKAVRIKSPYTATHAGWYVDFNNLSEEESFYIDNANKSSSWLRDKKGVNINEQYN